MRLQIGDRYATFDSKNLRIVDSDIEIVTAINDGRETVGKREVTLFDEDFASNFKDGEYEGVAVKYWDTDGMLVFEGVVDSVEYRPGRQVKLTLVSTVERALDSAFAYSASNVNPAAAVRAILEAAGAVVDETSYDAIEAVYDDAGIAAYFSWLLSDAVSRRDAVDDVCALFRFFVYTEKGKWHFWHKDVFDGLEMIEPDDVLNLNVSSESPDFTVASVEYEGGGSLAEFEGDTSRYGVVDETYNVSRAQNVMMNDLDAVTAAFNGLVADLCYRRIKAKFSSRRNLSLRTKYQIRIDAKVFELRLTSRTVSGAIFEYEGAMQ